MYAMGNPKTKQALKALVASGARVRAFQPGPFAPTTDGRATIEGPQYPAPHAWYAQVELKDGVIVKVIK
jgi:hypothetical protein